MVESELIGGQPRPSVQALRKVKEYHHRSRGEYTTDATATRARTHSESGKTNETASIRSGSSIGSSSYSSRHSHYIRNKEEHQRSKENIIHITEGPLGSSIEITPKKIKRGNRTHLTEIDDVHNTFHNRYASIVNAPQKMVSTSSKHDVIHGRRSTHSSVVQSEEHAGEPSTLGNGDVYTVRSRSASAVRSSSRSSSQTRDSSTTLPRPRNSFNHNHKRPPSTYVTRNQDAHIRSRSVSSTRSKSKSDNTDLLGTPSNHYVSQDYDNTRSRSVSRSRIPTSTDFKTSTSTSNSRSRSNSRSNSVSRSRSQTPCSRVSSGSSVISKSYLISEPNVHHNEIMTTRMVIECPSIAEMKENELFARKAGINFTREGGDSLTFVNYSEDDQHLIQDETYSDDLHVSPSHKNNGSKTSGTDIPENATFFRQSTSNVDKSRHIIESGRDLAQLRTTAGLLWSGWASKRIIAPTIARRIRDFQFAQEKRRQKFGNERPWGILGLYEHLSSVRTDVEWAEIAACRRANGEPYKAWFEAVDEKSTGKNRPFFTYIMMTICSGFMLASFAINGWKFESFSFNPMIGPSADTLTLMGAKDSLLIVQEKEVWRLLSAMVLHAGLVHFVLNMAAMYFVGSAIEFSHGFLSCMVMFVVPAIGGSILSAIFLPTMISVGASGGIFGLIGACLADIFMNWGLLFNEFVNGQNKHRHRFVLLVLLLDVILNCVIGLTPFVDNFTHLGGMMIGFFIGLSTMHSISTSMFGVEKVPETFFARVKRNLSKIFWGIFVVFIMGISFGILMNGDGVTTPCRACRSLSCVAFPPWADRDNKWWYCDDCEGITADARIDPVTREFDQISLNCPSGNIFVMDIGQDMNSDRDWLEERLPGWCRLHCLN